MKATCSLRNMKGGIVSIRTVLHVLLASMVTFGFSVPQAVEAADICEYVITVPTLYSNDTQPLDAYREYQNGTMYAEYCTTPNLQVLSKTKRYWWFYVALVAYKLVDTGLKFWNIVDECKHFNQSFQNGVNCLWDVGTTIVAWGGGAYKINGAIREITARYDKKRLFAELPQGGWKREVSPALDNFAEILSANGINLVGIDYIDRTEMTQNQTNRLPVGDTSGNQLVKRDGTLTTLVVSVLLNSTLVHYGIHEWSANGMYASIESANTLSKRSEFYDEYFNGNDGIDISICTNGADAGYTNDDGDFFEYFDDMHCHGDGIWDSQGLYWQTYDKNNRGTIDSGAMSPYFDGHASDIRQMTRCPAGLQDSCGDL